MVCFLKVIAQIAVPEATDVAMNYYHTGNILWVLQWICMLVIPLLFLVTGWSARWFANFTSLSMVIFLVGASFIWIFYLLLKKSPKSWWIYTSLTTMCVIFILTFVLPIWIDPLFNQFGPMKNKQIEKQILDLATKAGIGDVKLLEVDKSKGTSRGNAYVNGIGSTKRIVLWDRIIDEKHPERTLFIMGHEMGHYILNHVWLWMGYYTIVAFCICYLIYKISGFLLLRYQVVFRFQHLHDIASLPLFLVMINFFLFLQTPILNSISRYMERESDRFGIEITQDNIVAAEAFAGAVLEHLANPRPGLIYKIWRSHHPSLGDRVDFCNNYHPWTEGDPLKYANYFKSSENRIKGEAK